MQIARAMYEVTDALVEWTSHNFLQVQQGTFLHFREVLELVRIVDASEDGRIPKFAALSALRNHNAENRTSLTYEDIRDRDETFVFADCGEWVAFTDNPKSIIFGEHDSAELALSFAPDDVNWIIVWDTQDGVMVVYRSPWTGYRREAFEVDNEVQIADGEAKGDTLSYVLPPEMEASLHAMEKGELVRNQMRG